MVAQMPWLVRPVRAAICQGQNPVSLPAVIERMKTADFVEATNAIKSIEVTRVTRRELACLEITAPQVCIEKCLRALAREKMKAQPAAVSL